MNNYLHIPVSNDMLKEAVLDYFTTAELFEFIVLIDNAVCEWGFTKEVHEHFNKLMGGCEY